MAAQRDADAAWRRAAEAGVPGGGPGESHVPQRVVPRPRYVPTRRVAGATGGVATHRSGWVECAWRFGATAL